MDHPPGLAEQVGLAGQSRLHGFPGHAGFFRHAHGPGWALVGDAGYFKDPITAHGITDALRDAALLASAIDAGSDAALADYQEQRDAASLDVFEATDAIASFNWNLTTVRPLHEALSRAMSREVKLLVSASVGGADYGETSPKRLRREGGPKTSDPKEPS